MNYDLNITYPLMEDFYTIQGEGFNTGKAAYFLRLGGCDVGCVWCDVKESWPAENHPKVSISEMISRIEKAKAEMVVITGGEPCMYDLLPLTHSLHAKFMSCWLETSGAHPITGEWEWAEEHASKVHADCVLFLQPEHSVFNKVMPLIVDYVKQNPKWRISIQTHKVMQIP